MEVSTATASLGGVFEQSTMGTVALACVPVELAPLKDSPRTDVEGKIPASMSLGRPCAVCNSSKGTATIS